MKSGAIVLLLPEYIATTTNIPVCHPNQPSLSSEENGGNNVALVVGEEAQWCVYVYCDYVVQGSLILLLLLLFLHCRISTEEGLIGAR